MKLFTVFYFIILLCFLKDTAQAQTTYVSQDFSASNSVSYYVDNTSPDTGEFNAISNSAGSVTINGGQLEYVRSSVTGSGVLARTTDFSPEPGILTIQFDLTVPTSDSAQTTAAIFYIGQAFSTTTAVPSNANIHSRIGVNFIGNSGGFSLRRITTPASSSTTFTGQQTIRWVINNSGSAYTYTAPGGTSETLANDAADVFVGNTRVFDDIPATTGSAALTDFKFIFNGGGQEVQGSMRLDNISITRPADDPLPVEIISYNITVLKDNAVELQWRTASEINNAGFEIYRSDNSENSFKKIASYETETNLIGLGTSPNGKNYGYLDQSEVLKTGQEYFYKIVDVSFDGTRNEHGAKSVFINSTQSAENNSTSNIELLPNPTYDQAVIRFTTLAEESVTILIYNSVGQIAQAAARDVVYPAGAHHFPLSLSGLPAGIYTVFVQSKSISHAQPLSIIR